MKSEELNYLMNCAFSVDVEVEVKMRLKLYLCYSWFEQEQYSLGYRVSYDDIFVSFLNVLVERLTVVDAVVSIMFLPTIIPLLC